MGSATEHTEARARAWHHGRQALICDVVEPWAHGTVLRATRYPDYWDFNLLRVEEDPAMDVGELVAVADDALADCPHRRIDFDVIESAESRRSDFEALGWRVLRLLYMRHEEPSSPAPELAVEEVPYGAVDELRLLWHAEDFPGQDPRGYHDQAREVALSRGARVFAARRGDEIVGFSQLEHVDGSAEIDQVFVRPELRGAGLGTAITRASIDAAGPVDALWIAADDEDRSKDLYGRLGFRPVWTSMEITRLP